MTTLVDDRALSEILRGEREVEGPTYTTGLWYLRLCQAVFAKRSGNGVLSGPIAALPEQAQTAAMAALISLPDDVGLLSLRELAPTIASLRNRHRLNLLSIEALAAAKTLDARVLLTTSSPLLEEALAAENLSLAT